MDPIIERPHDYDYIFFIKSGQDDTVRKILREIKGEIKKYTSTSFDLRIDANNTEERFNVTIYSYLDFFLKPIIGDYRCKRADILNEHRQIFIKELKVRAKRLLTTNNKYFEQKR